MSESNLYPRLLIAATKLGARLFRNHVGVMYQGKTRRHADGSLIIQNPRVMQSGLCVGASDMIGFTPCVVTQEMVGHRVAIFTAVEAKAVRGVVSSKQREFLTGVLEHGGIAIVARSVEELEEKLSTAVKRIQG